jgi:hypothetical protein
MVSQITDICIVEDTSTPAIRIVIPASQSLEGRHVSIYLYEERYWHTSYLIVVPDQQHLNGDQVWIYFDRR